MTVPLSEKFESPLDEVSMELEQAAVRGVGIDDELAVGESSVEVDGVQVGTILSLSPFMTSNGWCMLARSAGFC
jgi:hypothetical protein